MEEAYEIDKQIENLLRKGVSSKELKKALRKKYGEEFFDYSYLNGLIYLLTDELSLYSEETVFPTVNTENEEKSVIAGKFAISADEDTLESPQSYTIKEKNNPERIIEFSTIERFINEHLGEKTPSSELSQYKREIATEKNRRNRCHELSIDAIQLFLKELKIEGQIVTGYVNQYVPQYKILHSWIEIETKNGPIVIDSTMNVAMNKEGYYKLKHVDEKSIISQISAKDVIDDMEKYRKNMNRIDELDLKEYLTSREKRTKKTNGRKPENDEEER